MIHRVALNIDSCIPHLGQLCPRQRASSSQGAAFHEGRVNEHGEGIPKLLQNRPRHLVPRAIPVIDGNQTAFFRDRLLPSAPSEKVLHFDHRKAIFTESRHLRLKHRRRHRHTILGLDLETVITKHDHRALRIHLMNLGRWRRRSRCLYSRNLLYC